MRRAEQIFFGILFVIGFTGLYWLAHDPGVVDPRCIRVCGPYVAVPYSERFCKCDLLKLQGD